MIEITYADSRGRERKAHVSETFPHKGETRRGSPVQVVWDWDWTQVPLDAPNACSCDKCEPIRGANDTGGIPRYSLGSTWGRSMSRPVRT